MKVRLLDFPVNNPETIFFLKHLIGITDLISMLH